MFSVSLCRDVLHRIRGFQDALPHDCIFVILNSFEFVSATACVTSFPFSFSIYVTAHCRQQCPSYTPCDKCKAHLSHQILFGGVMTLMPVVYDTYMNTAMSV